MNIQEVVRQINKELVPQFEEKLRKYLITQDKAWLIEQIIRLTLDAHSLEENDRKIFLKAKAKRRAERITRLQSMQLDATILRAILKKYEIFKRDYLQQKGYLTAATPEKGTALITKEHRTKKGDELLTFAKDLLFGLLFGDENTDTRFHRREREILTLTLPRPKAESLDFMKATTEFTALGTWQDPDSVSNDARADNVILEVEFGEVEGELIGKGIVLALSLINNLEVNEQILYARMINVEQSTLIE